MTSSSASSSSSVNEGLAAAPTSKNATAVPKVYDNWGLLKWIRPTAGPLDFSSSKRKCFVVLEHDSATLIIYDKKVCGLFTNGRSIADKCLALFPIHGATVYERSDLDHVSQSCYYFVIREISGNPVNLVVFAAPSVNERDRWVQKLQRMACVSRNLGIVQRQNEELKTKLTNASALLKIDVGEKLISNLITGKYNDTQNYKDLKEHLNEFVTIWEKVWRNKRLVHGQLLSNRPMTDYERNENTAVRDHGKQNQTIRDHGKQDKIVLDHREQNKAVLAYREQKNTAVHDHGKQKQMVLDNGDLKQSVFDCREQNKTIRDPREQLIRDHGRPDQNFDVSKSGSVSKSVSFAQEVESSTSLDETESSSFFSDFLNWRKDEFQKEKPEALLLNKVIRGMDHVRKKSILQSRAKELRLDPLDPDGQ